MPRVLFTTKYRIESDKLSEYHNIVSELKKIFETKEDVDLKIFKVKGKENAFQEIYEYGSTEVWEKSDDEEDERYELLMSKLSDYIVPKTTEYSTLFEMEE